MLLLISSFCSFQVFVAGEKKACMKVTFNFIKVGGMNESLDSFFEEVGGMNESLDSFFEELAATSLISKTSFLQIFRNF